MEDNKNENQEQKVNTEEIKKETVETVNQVKDAVKNVDIKNDAKEATGFVKNMFKDPFATMKSIVDDSKNKYLKTAIIFIIIWTLVVFIKTLYIKSWSFRAVFRNILYLIKAIIAPVLGIIVYSAIVYFMNKENKKSFVTTITAITTAKIPVIAAAVISLLTIFASSASKIIVPINAFASAISIVLTYFTAKMICGEKENSKFFTKFVIIEAIYYVAYILISFLEIYI